MSITLHTIDEIKDYFSQQDKKTYYFVSATNFNLMAISDWVNHWKNINFIDCYDGNNSSVLLAEYSETPIFKDIESINQFLLGNKKVVDDIKAAQKAGHETDAIFLFYDKKLEALVGSLDMNLIMPPNYLVRDIDSKITTTEIGNSVHVPSVPNAMLKIENFTQLRKAIAEHNLGDEVVVQTAYGDSGKTTFFIKTEEEYQAVAEKIEAEDKVKVMKKIPCLQVAMEACTTRQGTYIGPILTEIIGHPALTPYPGGWCGNDVNPEIFDATTQETMYHYTEKLGKALYERGYRGYFEVDYLIDVADRKSPQVYLGELNPRVTGISALTNMSAFCNETIPLYLFHLLEFSDIDFSLSPSNYNREVRDFAHTSFGQLIFKYTSDEMKIVTQLPRTGVYTMQQGKLLFARYADNPRNLAKDELFILQILEAGDHAYRGADILILFANQCLQNSDNQLTPIAESYIQAIEQAVEYRTLTEQEQQWIARYASRASLKSGAERQ